MKHKMKVRQLTYNDVFICRECQMTFERKFMSKIYDICKLCSETSSKDLVNNARVFIINYAINQNIEDAKKYGSIINITQGNINFWNTNKMIIDMQLILEKNHFDPNQDFILLNGAPPLNFAMGLLCAKYKRIETLIWDARIQRYKRKEFTL